MKKADVHVGATYLAKVSGNLVPVKIDREHDSGGWTGTNTKTGRQVRIKSAQRLRRPLADPASPEATPRQAAEHIQAVHKADQENARLAESADDTPKKKRIVTKAEYEAEAEAKDATDAPQRDTGERHATGAKREAKPMSLLDAAAHLLSLGTGDLPAGQAGPMRCKDIVDLAIQPGLWAPRNGGRTPANTLSAAMRREIKTKGDASRFRLAERGRFELNR